MKIKVFFVILVVAMLLFSACNHKQGDKNSNVAKVTPQPHTEQSTESSQTENYSGEPKLQVQDSVAYVFPQLTDNELYVACEFTNTSNCPCYVTEVNYTVELNGIPMSINSIQPANSHYSILPGESFYNATWFDYECKKNDTVSITAVDLKYEKSSGDGIELQVTDLFLVQNYPAFATVSGNMEQNSGTVSLNEIYTGFYDENNKLIGVWYFTESAELAPRQSRHFTSHMKSLPIENLCQNTKIIKAVGFGFNVKES